MFRSLPASRHWPLLLVVIASGVGSWLLIGDRSAPSDPLHGLAPAHATWMRQTTLRELMKSTDLVVRGAVVDIQPYAPITPADAGSAPDAPSMPRKLITLKVDDELFGHADASTITIVHDLPPEGSVLVEDPIPRLSEEMVVFLRHGFGPGGISIPGTWSRVSIDGRYKLSTAGRVDAMLPGGPLQAVREALVEPKRLLEAKS